MLPRAKKRFGQHFLTDRFVLDDIVAEIDPRPDDAMAEIGPGTGLLTERLAAVVSHLDVIEIDRDLAAALRARFPPSRVEVHEEDALEFDFSSLPRPLRIVGNLPYNISTPILFRVAEVAERVLDGIFLLQKEVVERMVARPSTPAYGRLSVMLQYRFAMEMRLRVHPDAFTPPPKVESALVRLEPLGKDRPRARSEAMFARVVAAAFEQRRKTLRNSLRGVLDDGACLAAGIDSQRRGETLSVEEFVRLADIAV